MQLVLGKVIRTDLATRRSGPRKKRKVKWFWRPNLAKHIHAKGIISVAVADPTATKPLSHTPTQNQSSSKSQIKTNREERVCVRIVISRLSRKKPLPCVFAYSNLTSKKENQNNHHSVRTKTKNLRVWVCVKCVCVNVSQKSSSSTEIADQVLLTARKKSNLEAKHTQRKRERERSLLFVYLFERQVLPKW